MKIATTPWEWPDQGAGRIAEQASIAESMGFHSFWVPENHFRANSFPAPLLSLAAAAGCTSTIRLGCVSYLLPIRNAVLAAEEVAVLDQISNGRLILGLGRGLQSDVFDAFGIDSGAKRRLFAERLEIMRRAWSGQPILENSGGRPITLAPLPVQRPSPPLWVAAFGQKALQQVAGLGLPYLASPMESLEQLKVNYGSYRRMLQEQQMPAVSTTPVMRTVFVSRSDRQSEDVRRALGDQLPRHVRDRAGPVSSWAIIGSSSYVHEQLCQYREELAITHLILRAGLPHVSTSEQLQSHEELLALRFPG